MEALARLIGLLFRFFFKLLFALTVVCAILVGWGVAFEPGLLRVTLTNIESDRWPSFWQPLRIAVVSDFHIGSPHIGISQLNTIVDSVNAQEPDVVFLLGDYMTGDYFEAVGPETFAPILGKLTAKHGVFAVLGEHDWRTGNASVGNALAKAGITVLRNQSKPVVVAKGRRFWVVGLADRASGDRPDYAKAGGKIPKGEPIFALMHNPAEHTGVSRKVTVSFAGHTHGGLLNIPFAEHIMLVPADVPKRYARGLVNDAGQLIYVTSGIGASGIPIRVNLRPEVSIISVSGK